MLIGLGSTPITPASDTVAATLCDSFRCATPGFVSPEGSFSVLVDSGGGHYASQIVGAVDAATLARLGITIEPSLPACDPAGEVLYGYTASGNTRVIGTGPTGPTYVPCSNKPAGARLNQAQTLTLLAALPAQGSGVPSSGTPSWVLLGGAGLILLALLSGSKSS